MVFISVKRLQVFFFLIYSIPILRDVKMTNLIFFFLNLSTLYKYMEEF